jgi:peptidoglycan/LPS O-acetylase OafA/YrhL
VRRILPAAAVTLLITIPLANALVTLINRSAVMQDAASAALSVANIRFAMTTDYFHPVNYSPFLHFWSLGVEEQFYFVWPALLAIVAWKWPRPGAAVALTVVVVVSFIASVAMTYSSASTAFYMLPTRAWQLAAGGLLAVGSGSLEVLPKAMRGALKQILAFAGWAALAALITAAFLIDSVATPYPGTAALIPTIAGVVLIASGPESTGPGILLRLPPIRFLGKISYSLYLWHWPVLVLGGLFLTTPLQPWLSSGQALALAGLSIPVAVLSWFFVEEPFRRGVIPLPRPSRVGRRGGHARRRAGGDELRLWSPVGARRPRRPRSIPHGDFHLRGDPQPDPDLDSEEHDVAGTVDHSGAGNADSVPRDDPGLDARSGPRAARFVCGHERDSTNHRQGRHRLRAALA